MTKKLSLYLFAAALILPVAVIHSVRIRFEGGPKSMREIMHAGLYLYVLPQLAPYSDWHAEIFLGTSCDSAPDVSHKWVTVTYLEFDGDFRASITISPADPIFNESASQSISDQVASWQVGSALHHVQNDFSQLQLTDTFGLVVIVRSADAAAIETAKLLEPIGNYTRGAIEVWEKMCN